MINFLKKYIFCFCCLSMTYSVVETRVTENEITIRSTTDQDKEAYLKVATNPLVSENHAGEYKIPKRQIEYSMQYWKNKQRTPQYYYEMYKIMYNDQIVGFIELYGDHSDSEVAYIAYSVDPKYWKKGIGTIAVKKIIKQFTLDLKKIKVKYIRATVRINNPGSIKVLEKNNFKVIEEKFFAGCPVKVLELIL